MKQSKSTAVTSYGMECSVRSVSLVVRVFILKEKNNSYLSNVHFGCRVIGKALLYVLTWAKSFLRNFKLRVKPSGIKMMGLLRKMLRKYLYRNSKRKKLSTFWH